MHKFFCLLILLFVANMPNAWAQQELERLTPSEAAALESKINLYIPSIRLGELIEIISEQSGERLETDNNKPLSSEEITVYLTGVPLSKVMSALSALLSYRNAPCQWYKKSDDKGRKIYIFLPSKKREVLNDALQTQIDDDFEAQGWKEINRVGASSKGSGKSISDHDLGVQSLSSILSEKQLTDVMRGQKTFTIRPDNLGNTEKDYIKRSTDSVIPPPAYPDAIRIVRYKSGAEITPSVYFCLVNGNITRGHALLGGVPFQNKWRDKLNNLWILPGERTETSKPDTDRSEVNQTLSKVELKEEAWRKYPIDNIVDVANKKVCSFLATVDVQRSNATIGGDLSRKTSSEILNNLQSRSIDHKWCDDILLFNDLSLLLREDWRELVPWIVYKNIRDAKNNAGDNFIPFDAIVHHASILTDNQLKSLSKEFTWATSISKWRDLLLLCRRKDEVYRALCSDRGYPFRELPDVVRVALKRQGQTQNASKITYVRFQQQAQKYSYAGREVVQKVVWLEARNEKNIIVIKDGIVLGERPALSLLQK